MRTTAVTAAVVALVIGSAAVGAVRRHLEHLYAELGCSDRLVAVHRARERGWLPPL